MAYVRAYHVTENAEQTLFRDHLAPGLLSLEELAQMEEVSLASVRAVDPKGTAACADRGAQLALSMQRVSGRALPLARARFVEDALQTAIAAGTRQVVLVGAGLDTFAWRHPELLGEVAVFELDHPATQADKRARLARAGLEEPAAVHFVAVDFTVTPIDEALAGTPFDPTRLAFFSWPGVSYYLPSEAVDGALTAMRRCTAAGGCLAFDYLDDAAFGPDAAPEMVQAMEQLRRLGEPFITSLSPGALGADLAKHGWALDTDMDAVAIESAYLRPTLPGYRATSHFHFALAHAR